VIYNKLFIFVFAENGAFYVQVGGGLTGLQQEAHLAQGAAWLVSKILFGMIKLCFIRIKFETLTIVSKINFNMKIYALR
jgi:hypothetical protein